MPWWVPLLWVAAVATTLGYALGVMAVPRVGSRIASFVGLSEVLFALGFAWLLLGEALRRDGRRVEALRTCERLRRVLADAGLAPGPELIDLERRIAGTAPPV